MHHVFSCMILRWLYRTFSCRYMPSATLHFPRVSMLLGKRVIMERYPSSLFTTVPTIALLMLTCWHGNQLGRCCKSDISYWPKHIRVHFISATLKDVHFPDSKFPRTLSKTFQSEKKSDNKLFQFYYFVICHFDVP